jgi:hypothetical protein
MEMEARSITTTMTAMMRMLGDIPATPPLPRASSPLAPPPPPSSASRGTTGTTTGILRSGGGGTDVEDINQSPPLSLSSPLGLGCVEWW